MKFINYLLIVFAVFRSTVDSRNHNKPIVPRPGESCLLVRVANVIDGTNVEVEIKNLEFFGNFTVHLLGLHGPSMSDDFGENSRKHFIRLLGKKRLTLIIGSKWNTAETVNGTLYAGKVNINKKMISDGYAWCYDSVTCKKLYYKESVRSMRNRKGIWKQRANSSKKKPNHSKKEQVYDVEVVNIIDGDTVKVRKINSSETIKVRMDHIDAPEMKQAFGIEARNKLVVIIGTYNSSLPLQLSVSGKDVYRRSLGVLKSGNNEINKEMVEAGYAWCYRHTQCPQSYQRATEEARNGRKGLFTQENPMTPWDWRKQNQKQSNY